MRWLAGVAAVILLVGLALGGAAWKRAHDRDELVKARYAVAWELCHARAATLSGDELVAALLDCDRQAAEAAALP